MMGFKRGVVLGALVALAACGPDNNPVGGPGDVPRPVVDAAPDPEQPPEAPSVPSAPEEPSPLPPPAIDPRAEPQQPSASSPATRRYETACSRWEYRHDGSLQKLTRLGADGLLREEQSFRADGAELSHVLQQVESGRVTVRETLSGTQVVSRQEWTYGGHGEVLQYRSFNPTGLSRAVTSVYDSQGRLERQDITDGTGTLLQQNLYTYGEQGLVRRLQKEGHGAYIYESTTYTYHPNGQLAREDFQAERSHVWREFDTEGREVLSGHEFDESGARTEQRYDARGQLVRRVSTGNGSSSSSVHEETFEYDAAGRLAFHHLTASWENHWTGALGGRTEANRYAYDARGDLVLRTSDTNEDGTPDWRRLFIRDAFGNLLEEKLEGTPGANESGRVIYTYECHE